MISRRSALGAAAALAAGTRIARAEARITIAIQYGIGYLPVMVADKAGLFRKHAAANGVDAAVVLTRMSGATAVNDALISGSIDVGAYGLPGMLIARERARNYDIRGLASLSTLPYGLYTNDPSIHSLKDIKPTDRIAVTAPNTPQAELLRMAAEKELGDAHKLDPQMVSLPHPDSTASLISRRGVTLYFATPPFSAALDREAGIHQVIGSKEITGEEITGGMLACTGRFATAPGRARTVVDALREAGAAIAADPGRAAAIYIEAEAARLDPAALEKLIRDNADAFGTQPHGTLRMANFMFQQKELKAPLARWQDAWFPPVNEGQGS